MRQTIIATGLCLLLTLPVAVTAQPVQENNSNTVWFENWIGLSNATMRVATPDGEITDVVAERGTPVFMLKGDVADGLYRYELRAATEEMVKNRDYNEDSVFNTGDEYIPKPFYVTGAFRVERGAIVNTETREEGKEE